MKNNNISDSKKLGQMLMERGSLRKEQVSKLLMLQKQDSTAGVQSKFGELCVRTGWADAGDVTTTLIEQKKDRSEAVGLGDILISLKYLTSTQLQDSLETQIDVFDTLEEIVIDHGFCTPEQIYVANQLLSLHRNSAARQPIASTFVPFNIMELLIAEQLDEALKIEGGCRCSQCWGNTFSVALNDLPPRYISDHGRILDCVYRFRQEYSQLVQSKLANAVARVRANPKATCRSRFSDELLARRRFQGRLHEVLVHVSNRHIHLSQKHLEKLFGPSHELTKLKDLMQTGQYAAKETLALEGPKGRIERVRVLGPVRSQTQVEISGTDQFVLGIKVPVRESGHLEGTPGIKLIGPGTELQIHNGAIRALRHVHMLPEQADEMGLKNGEKVVVRLVGDRTTICEGVLVRATETSALEMHIDTDEANAAGLSAESTGQILIPKMNV